MYDIHTAIEKPHPIYLLPGVDIEPDETEWEMLPGSAIMVHHKPTNCIFEIGWRPEDVQEDGTISLSKIFSFLNHQCGPNPVPAGDELVRLGRLALLLFASTVSKEMEAAHG